MHSCSAGLYTVTSTILGRHAYCKIAFLPLLDSDIQTPAHIPASKTEYLTVVHFMQQEHCLSAESEKRQVQAGTWSICATGLQPGFGQAMGWGQKAASHLPSDEFCDSKFRPSLYNMG